MKIQNYVFPNSRFLSLEKDLNIIVSKLLTNKRLKKLLYYDTKDCLQKPDLTNEQELSLLGDRIKIVPKIKVDNEIKTYLLISFNDFITNATNPEFRDNVIEFDIICHVDQWQLKDFELRPYKIAGEIDTMLNNSKLTGIGELKFRGASQMILTDEYAGICLMYNAIHGEEDKKFMPNPSDEEQFLKEFNEMYNE